MKWKLAGREESGKGSDLFIFLSTNAKRIEGKKDKSEGE